MIYSLLKRFLLSFFILVAFSLTVTAQEKEPFFRNIESSFTYSSDLFTNLSGGLETGVRYMDNIDVDLRFDTKGFSFYLYGLGNQGKSITEIVGDVQTVSNIDTENSWRLYEAWIHRSIPKIRSSLLFGLYDLNSEFDVTNTGGLFLNSSHGIGPDFSSSGVTGPSIFPLTSLSARLKINPFRGISIKVAILDAVPSDPNNTSGTTIYLRESEGTLVATELEFSKFNSTPESFLERGVNENSPFRIILGGWKYTQERDGWFGTPESDHGVYSIVEFNFKKGLSIFGRAGLANRDINRFNGYLGWGVSYAGLFENRVDDQVGLAFSQTFNSDDFVRTQSQIGNDFSNNEMNIEFTYLLIISNKVSVQFDTQYIQHPNQAPGIDDAFVVGVRSVFGF